MEIINMSVDIQIFVRSLNVQKYTENTVNTWNYRKYPKWDIYYNIRGVKEISTCVGLGLFLWYEFV